MGAAAAAVSAQRAQAASAQGAAGQDWNYFVRLSFEPSRTFCVCFPALQPTPFLLKITLRRQSYEKRVRG